MTRLPRRSLLGARASLLAGTTRREGTQSSEAAGERTARLVLAGLDDLGLPLIADARS